MKHPNFFTRCHHRMMHNGSSLAEKCYAASSAFLAIAILIGLLDFLSLPAATSLLVLASMGASTFLIFVVPHSPMAQPWPLIGGHLIAAAVGVSFAKWLPDPLWATAASVGLAIFLMYLMHCLHPPGAATAMIAVLGGAEVHQAGWQFVYLIVGLNAGILFLLAWGINNLIPGRHYPLNQQHHPHHQKFSSRPPSRAVILTEVDFSWALAQIDALIDVNETDLIDLYEFAIEHAEQRQNTP